MSSAIVGPYVWDRRGHDTEIVLDSGECIAFRLSDGNAVRIKVTDGRLIVMSDDPIVVAPRAANSFEIVGRPA